jgi:hypothetical protein
VTQPGYPSNKNLSLTEKIVKKSESTRTALEAAVNDAMANYVKASIAASAPTLDGTAEASEVTTCTH